MQEESKQTLKDRIIDEAIALFSEFSVKFNMSEIARKLNISKKTIYKHFDNKESLLISCVDKIFDDIGRINNTIINENLSPIIKLKKVLIVFPNVKDLNEYHIEDLKNNYISVYKQIILRLNSNWDLTFTLLDECKSKGLIKDVNNESLKFILTGLFESVLTERKQEDIIKECVEYLFDGIATKNASGG